MVRQITDTDGNLINVPEPGDEAPAPPPADVLAAGNTVNEISYIRSSPLTGEPMSTGFSMEMRPADNDNQVGGLAILASGSVTTDTSDLGGSLITLIPANGDDNAGHVSLNGGFGTYNGDIAYGATVYSGGSSIYEGNFSGGNASIIAGDGPNSTTSGAGFIADGGGAEGVSLHGRAGIRTNNSYGSAGDVLTADGTGYAEWAAPTTTLTGAADNAGGQGASFTVYGGSGANGGIGELIGGDGASDVSSSGGDANIGGGVGRDAQLAETGGAAIFVGGGTPSGPGAVQIKTYNDSGSLGDVLMGDLYGKAAWSSPVTTASSTPVGGGFVSILVADTTNKNLYAWTGSDYTKIGDWS